MSLITRSQHTRLRQRLQAWAAQHPDLANETMSDQIDHLLEDVLSHEPTPAAVREPLDERDDDQRVVITGIGLVSPFGVGMEPFWKGLCSGTSAIRPITLCAVDDMPCQIGGEVPDFVARDFMEAREARRMTRHSQFAVAAARLALDDADLSLSTHTAHETGALIACGGTSYPDTEQAIQTLLERGPLRVSPLYVPLALPHMSAAQVALHYGLRGYVSSISTACAASTQAIGEAAEVIRRGDAEVMLAGGTEAPISRIGLASFCALHALSTRNDEPARASRPFDEQRDGFVPGEGCGLLVLERLSHARARGARIYSELVGYASTCDAHHITQPDPAGKGAALAMQRALWQAGLSPQQVDYINAHATSTPVGDIAETRAIKQVFGEYAYSIPVSAPKSMFGHLTGAAGAVEAAATVLALHHGCIPPTINQDEPDPACDLDYVPHEARSAELQTVISNSFAFGGINAVLVFRTCET